MDSPSRQPRLVAFLVALLGWVAALVGEGLGTATEAPWMELEELCQVRVSTATRSAQTIQESAAAVAVVTARELRQTGATSFPEALRLIPGMAVARLHGSRYAINTRAFNGEFAGDQLVLIDGRSIYSPQFSGVFWDTPEFLLADVDRIEVLRGPGGTAWGTNAFQGVINVVSKSARDTPGTWAHATVGSHLERSLAVRYGGEAGPKSWYRVWGQTGLGGATLSPDGARQDDENRFANVGFRLDHHPRADQHLTLQGGWRQSRPLQFAQGLPSRFRTGGGHWLSRWENEGAEGQRWVAQAWYDAMRHDPVQNAFHSDTLDVEIRRQDAPDLPWHWHWGVNYRYTDNRPVNTPEHVYNPSRQRLHQTAVFADLEVFPNDDPWQVALGARAEYYQLTGWEILPTLRANWAPTERQSLWLSLGRGIRAPSLVTYYLSIDTPTRRSLPNADRVSQKAWSAQFGHRWTWNRRLSSDLVLYHTRYEDLRTVETLPDLTPTTTIIGNLREGSAWGGEWSLNYQATYWWRWKAGLSCKALDLHTRPGSTDFSPIEALDRSPDRQWFLWWSFHPHHRLDLDLMARWVGELPAIPIPSYLALDLRLAFRPDPRLEIALVGRNLNDPSHPEFSRSPGFPQVGELPRSAALQLTWDF